MTTKLYLNGLSAAALVLLAATAAGAESDPWDWCRLEMDARSGWFLTGKVELAIAPEGGATLLTSTTSARLFGASVARSRTRSRLDPATGHAREYQSFTPKRGRHYTFGERSYRVKKLDPPEAGYDAPVDRWVVTSDEEFPYPTIGGKRRPVFDPYGLLVNLKRLPLNAPGDAVDVYVATSRGPQRYTIRVAEAQSRKRTVRDETSRTKQTLETDELLLEFEPEDSDADDKGLLGMSGTIEIWVEARTKTLIFVAGKIPDVPGRVVLKLSALG